MSLLDILPVDSLLQGSRSLEYSLGITM